MSKTQRFFRDGKWQADELANHCERMEREKAFMIAELSGAVIGLMTHPSDTPLNGCLISEASKLKIQEINKIIKRYGGSPNPLTSQLLKQKE